VTIITPDTVPPGDVNPLRAYRGVSGSVLLTWVNPSDGDFARTVVRYRTDAFPASPADGVLVCDRPAGPGSSDSFSHSVPAGAVYYTAFACDLSYNYAGGVQKPASLVWLDDPFDTYGDGALDGQGGWTRSDANNSCIVQGAVHAGASGKAVELYGTNVYDGASLANFGTLVGGYHKVSFDMTQGTAPSGNQAIIEIFGAGQKITRVYWSSSYNILTGPGPAVSTLVAAPVSGRWYHIEIGIDLDNRTIDAWVDGAQKYSALPFYQSSGQIEFISLTGFNPATSLSYLDNLQGRRIGPAGGPADFDVDGDVDQDDLGMLLTCMTGPGQGPPAAGCEGEDLDADSDVDQADFGRFQKCISGRNVPADPSCGD